MSAKFTKGPWEVEVAPGGSHADVFVTSRAHTIAALYGDWPDEAPPQQRVANARLIAAAPKLYALAEKVKRLFGGAGEPYDELGDQAAALLREIDGD